MNSENFYRPLSIGKLTLDGNLLAAPLAGFSDRAFRDISLNNGASLCYTEMVSCEALLYDSEKSIDLLKRGECEKKYAVQIFTGRPEIVAQAMEHILPFNPSLIDINAGCPIKKINKSGAGAALMEFPKTIAAIVKEVKKAIASQNEPIAVTVKFRSGIDSSHINFLEVGKSIEDAGADGLALHPRTKKQVYSGKADWDHIRRLKETVNIPVLGSGDLFYAEDAKKMFNETGCDGVMFARGAIGNPFIFNQTKDLLLGNPVTQISPLQRLNCAQEHLELAFKLFLEHYASREMRKHLCSYTKGLPDSARLRNLVVHCKTQEEYLSLFDEYRKTL